MRIFFVVAFLTTGSRNSSTVSISVVAKQRSTLLPIWPRYPAQINFDMLRHVCGEVMKTLVAFNCAGRFVCCPFVLESSFTWLLRPSGGCEPTTKAQIASLYSFMLVGWSRCGDRCRRWSVLAFNTGFSPTQPQVAANRTPAAPSAANPRVGVHIVAEMS